MSLSTKESSIAHDTRRKCEFCSDGYGKKRKLSSKGIENQILNTNDEKFIGESIKTLQIYPKTPENINDLSPEVFQLIVAGFIKISNWRKLIPLRLVCKHWRSNIDSYLSSRQCFCYIVEGAVTKGGPLPGMNYFQFFAMTRFYPNVRQLSVKNFTVSDHMVSIISQNCQNIDRLSIFGCRGLSWKGITILSVRLSELTFLDISHCELDELRFSILIEGLQKLKTLNAINLGREATGKCLSKLGNNIEDIWIGLNHLSDPNPALEALVSGNGKNLIHFGLVVKNFQKTNLNLITDNMKNLKSLKLTFGSNGYGTLKNIGKLTDLEFLILAEDSISENDSVINDFSLISIIRGCKKLKNLAIALTKANTCRFTHSSISQIPIYCQQMEQIRFVNCNNVLDESLLELANLQSIRVLHLNSMANISDTGIINFVKKAEKTVRNFRVTDCKKITEAIIQPWINLAEHRTSETISLYLEGVVVKQCLDGLPSNLKMNVK